LDPASPAAGATATAAGTDHVPRARSWLFPTPEHCGCGAGGSGRPCCSSSLHKKGVEKCFLAGEVAGWIGCKEVAGRVGCKQYPSEIKSGLMTWLLQFSCKSHGRVYRSKALASLQRPTDLAVSEVSNGDRLYAYCITYHLDWTPISTPKKTEPTRKNWYDVSRVLRASASTSRVPPPIAATSLLLR
jgi:hypothetical protein